MTKIHRRQKHMFKTLISFCIQTTITICLLFENVVWFVADIIIDSRLTIFAHMFIGRVCRLQYHV
jgi:hypothetical protein